MIVPCEKRTAHQDSSITGGNEVVACPERLFVVYDPEYVIPAFPDPPLGVFFGDIPYHVGQAARSAALAGDVVRAVHLQAIPHGSILCKQDIIDFFTDPYISLRFT